MKKLLSKKRYLKYYLLGVADSEGCFSIATKKQKTARFRWILDPLFQITQHKNNIKVLELFQKELKCGRIIEKPGQKNILVYLVDNRRQLKEKIIPFFEKYKLLTKQKDFQTFKEVVEALENKEHHNKGKFKKLVKKVFEMNLQGKQRRYELEKILNEIEETGSSETIRQTS